MNDEIQRIISGKSKVRYGTNIQVALTTLEKARKQALWIKQTSTSKVKKQRD